MPVLKLSFGFSFPELFDPLRLADLTQTFDKYLEERDPSAAKALLAYREAGGELPSVEASNAITGAAPHLSAFVAELFGIEKEREASLDVTRRDKFLFDFKKEVVKKRVLRRAPEQQTLGDALPQYTAVLESLGVPESQHEDERAVVLALWPRFQALDRLSRSLLKGGDAPLAEDLAEADAARERLKKLEIDFEEVEGEDPARAAQLALTALLTPVERFLSLWHRDHETLFGHGGTPHPWVTLRHPRKLDHNNLVALRRPDEKRPELATGPVAYSRERDGFSLTDQRMDPRQVLSEIDYCLLCHVRGRDSCSTGFKEKDGEYKRSPSGAVLTGCPLEEKISEAHTLQADGDMIGALALVTIDNPMCAGTGHRICNDCMKGCIFQKQDPVNVPEAETHALVRVLDMPWGLEIYGLLGRWNPLHPTRPHPRPYTGKNVLVVGLGPAGYTLAHHLLCEGFGVAAIDGLKIEPLPEGLVPPAGKEPTPVHDWRDFYEDLAERRMLGFGGVSEYGITVRWDKNFLTVIAANLMRWNTFKAYGGIRFGGTLDLDDAWNLGFHHVAICAGAGKPTLVDIPNGMIRGIRQASDFLMALQLTGAFRKSSLANLQVQLPAVVIGGGLTAIDTGTELAAYYVVQVEKTLERFEALCAKAGSEGEVLARFSPEEQAQLVEAVEHGRAIRAERELAAKQGREPAISQLLDSWGGVTVIYRRGLKDSPAYRLNHEEVQKALEEGLKFAEFLSPKEALPDEHGAVRGLIFDRMEVREHRLVPTGEELEVAARTVCVAAGTAPNVTYEREFPGTFVMDTRTKAFAPHRMEKGEDGQFQPVPDPKGFFTSYNKGGNAVSFYGDNLPAYAGSVVKAMASAKDGYPFVSELFREEWKALSHERESVNQRLAQWKKTAAHLDDELVGTVHEVKRLTPTITEVVVRSPLAARKFHPGQFYRLQNFEVDAPTINGVQLATEGLALTGAWTDPEKGLLSTIVLELGVSSRVVASFRPGQRVVLMGPTGAPTEIPKDETVLLAGGGLGNAVLFSIGRALRANGCKVVYFAGYRTPQDVFRRDDIEASADQVVWAVDKGAPIEPRRPQDRSFVGNIVQAMVAFAHGELGKQEVELSGTTRILAIGSDRMMEAVRDARKQVLRPYLPEEHVALGSINSPMQCMMKEICAQCLQRHVDPSTGKHFYVFSCFQQDQNLDTVDFENLNSRLRQSSMQEKLSDLYLEHLLEVAPLERV